MDCPDANHIKKLPMDIPPALQKKKVRQTVCEIHSASWSRVEAVCRFPFSIWLHTGLNRLLERDWSGKEGLSLVLHMESSPEMLRKSPGHPIFFPQLILFAVKRKKTPNDCLSLLFLADVHSHMVAASLCIYHGDVSQKLGPEMRGSLSPAAEGWNLQSGDLETQIPFQ